MLINLSYLVCKFHAIRFDSNFCFISMCCQWVTCIYIHLKYYFPNFNNDFIMLLTVTYVCNNTILKV